MPPFNFKLFIMSLKNIFWKDNSPAEAPKPASTIKPTGPSGIAPIGSTSVGVIPAADPTFQSEFGQYLDKILQDANLPGPDYYEFANALNTLKASPLTEEQKYVTIFAGFAAQGVTPQALVDAAQKYIAILGQKKSTEFDTSVQSAELAIKTKEESIRVWGEENIKLSNQIADNAKKISDATTEVNQMKTKVEVKKTTFNMAYQNFIKKIMDDIENIKKYLYGNSTK